VKNRRWSDQLLSLLQIDKALLPAQVRESHEVSGALTKAAAALLGLAEGTPVVGGSGDQPAGAVGNGIVTAGVVSATLGTSGVVFAHSDQPTLDPQGRVHTMCHAVAGKWCVFGCMLSAGGSFQWFRNTLAEAEVVAAKKHKVDPYEILVREAQQATPGGEGLFFLPYLTGERCPHPDPYARGGWIGMTARTKRRDLIRSLLEGVTFGMRDAVEIMRQMNIPVSQVRASGGGARSAFWRQLQADIYKTPVVITNAAEGPAYGVALLAGIGAGVWNTVEDACRSGIKQSEKLKPNRQIATKYEPFYQTYRKLYGDPMKTSFKSNGFESWEYEFVRMQSRPTNFIPYVNLVHSGAVVSITVTPDEQEAGRPDLKVDSGDVANVTLIVGTKRPIEYVV